MPADTRHAARQLGTAGPKVFPLALGCMGMSGMYGPADESESISTIHMALDRGVTLLDTGDFYGMGHNEMLIGRALKGRRDEVLLSVKFGALRGPDGAWFGYDARPMAVKNFLAYSLKRLGVDHIDIYRPARLDPTVPIEDTIGTTADMVKAGHVRAIGLSEVGVETIRRAHAVHPICDLQIEYSLISRGPEAKIFPVLAELGIGVTVYGVLSRGLLSSSRPAAQGDIRSHMPRFVGDNLARNSHVVAGLRAVCRSKARESRATCDCLGARERREHRADHRRAHAGAARRIAGGAGRQAVSCRSRSHRRGRARLRGRRNALRRSTDEAS